MGLDNIEQAVLSTAHAQAEHIVQAAQKAADDRIAAFREAETQAAERRYQTAARNVEEELGRVLIQHRGAKNKALLEKRNARLREVFSRARQRLLEGSLDDYATLMRALLTKCGGKTAAKVRVHPDDERTFFALLAEVNKTRPSEAALELDAAHPLPTRGGFVLVSAGYEVDQTLDTLMDDVERAIAPEIAARLFGTGNKG